jgi:hypothetical protein
MEPLLEPMELHSDDHHPKKPETSKMKMIQSLVPRVVMTTYLWSRKGFVILSRKKLKKLMRLFDVHHFHPERSERGASRVKSRGGTSARMRGGVLLCLLCLLYLLGERTDGEHRLAPQPGVSFDNQNATFDSMGWLIREHNLVLITTLTNHRDS